jgi:hypothetical protein
MKALEREANRHGDVQRHRAHAQRGHVESAADANREAVGVHPLVAGINRQRCRHECAAVAGNGPSSSAASQPKAIGSVSHRIPAPAHLEEKAARPNAPVVRHDWGDVQQKGAALVGRPFEPSRQREQADSIRSARHAEGQHLERLKRHHHRPIWGWLSDAQSGSGRGLLGVNRETNEQRDNQDVSGHPPTTANPRWVIQSLQRRCVGRTLTSEARA